MRPDSMFGLISLALIVVIVLLLYHKKFIYAVFFIVIAAIYINVGTGLNKDVREASTHGNTIHGWYSKKNGSEKFKATMWFYFFPIAAIIGTALLIGYFTTEKKNS
jgi:hypothetical protein